MKRNVKILSALLSCLLCLTTLVGCMAQNAPDAMIGGDQNNAAMAPSGGYFDGNSNVVGSDDSLSDWMGTENEDYTEIVENSFVNAAETPDSYFSVDANTAAYPNLRSLIRRGLSIPKDAVRVEEMLNYFSYDYQTPAEGAIFALNASMFDTPYNAKTKLLTIGLAAQEVEFESVQNNLVFLIDVSGSMYSSDKLPLVQAAFMMLTENLNPGDRISIVTYASGDSVALEGAHGDEKQKIMAVIEDLQAGGSTAGSKGIERAYELATRYFIEGGNNRVILATDGDFNVGVTGTDALEKLIAQKRESGVYFSVIGVGRGNLKSDKMETLALKGNGTYHYIDSVKEAKRALVEQIGGSMVTVAKDVKAGVTFNPEYVESYRLIGYENKLLTEDQFNDESTDAGEIGSGHTVTVVYEIKLTDKALVEGENIAQVKLRYKPTENSTGDTETKESVLDVGTSVYHPECTDTDSFVAAVVEFALILRQSEYRGEATLEALIARLKQLDVANDEFRQEFVELVGTYYENCDQEQEMN